MPRPIQSEKLVFPASQGGYINLDNWRRRAWKEAFKKTGVPYRPLYQMRHTYATLALAAGADVYWVSGQLGHTSIQTTLGHYARFLPAVDERNLKLLDDLRREPCQIRVINRAEHRKLHLDLNQNRLVSKAFF